MKSADATDESGMKPGTGSEHLLSRHGNWGLGMIVAVIWLLSDYTMVMMRCAVLLNQGMQSVLPIK